MERTASFRAGGVEYTVRFDFRTWFLYEQHAGAQLGASSLFSGTTEPVLYQELAWAVLAGLESERIATGSKRAPWTLDEVLGAVLVSPDVEDVIPAYRACARAYAGTAAHAEAKDDGEGKAPTTEG